MTNKPKKMTKKDYFDALLNIPEVGTNEELVAFIEHEIDLLENKGKGDKKPTATQIANNEIKEAILNGMEEKVLYTITDLQKKIPECEELSNQKVNALVHLLITEKRVERIEEKRKAYFRKALV